MMNDIRIDISKIANDLGLSIFAGYEKHIKTGLPFEENLLGLLREQAIETDNARINRRVRYSGFPIVKTLDRGSASKTRKTHVKELYI